jgi:hypothetical protein
MIAAAAAPSVTRSQGVGVCYPDGSAVKLTPPKFVQSGHDFTVVTDTDGSEPVSDLTLSVNGRAPAPIPAPPSAAQFPTPDTSAPTIRLVFAWTQGAGTAAACTGGQTFWVRVVPEDARVGAADEPRVSAIYAITYTPRGRAPKQKPSKWTITPACDFGACTVRIRSTGVIRMVARLQGSVYQGSGAAAKPGACYSFKTHKLLVLNAYRETDQLSFSVTEGDLHADTIHGQLTRTFTATLAAIRAKCLAGETDHYAFAGTALR